MEQSLKLSKEYFEHVRNGTMNFQVRKNDRNYRVGDTLIFKEYGDKMPHYTGRTTTRIVKYILQGQFGLPNDICVLGF